MSHLIFASDALYVVKFLGNPQHRRILANEWFATCLAQALELPVPEAAVIHVSDALLRSTPLLNNDEQTNAPFYAPGIHFGSRFIGGLMPGKTVDYLPGSALRRVKNLAAFCGALVFDKWTCNADVRQSVFLAHSRERAHTAYFIDHGFCFNSSSWRLEDHRRVGCFPKWEVYAEVCGVGDFEPWLDRLLHLDASRILQAAKSIPQEWYDFETPELYMLVDQLDKRRTRVWEMVKDLRNARPHIFPRWT